MPCRAIKAFFSLVHALHVEQPTKHFDNDTMAKRQEQLEAEKRAIDEYVRSAIKADDVYSKYEEGAELGAGAYGRVWKGTDLVDSDREFAIKTIRCPDEKALGREVKVRAALAARAPTLPSCR